MGWEESDAGEYHSVFLRGDGTVWTVGKNDTGQLGDGSTLDKSDPVQVVDGSGNPFRGVAEISAGRSYTLFLLDDTTVFGTGQNNYGQLGDGTTTQRNHPVLVEDGTGSPFPGWLASLPAVSIVFF